MVQLSMTSISIESNYFIDTSFLIALEFERDQNHKLANESWHNIPKNYNSLIISDYIYDELITFF